MNWDDLRFFLALYRATSLSGAARKLGVNHATVGRRIEALAASTGGELFTKTPAGFIPTPLGEAILEPALEAEQGVLATQRALQDADRSLKGEVRVATTQLLSCSIIVPVAMELHTLHPGLRLDVIEGTSFLSLARQEADISLRFQMAPQPRTENVRVRYLGPMAWHVYASKTLSRRYGLTSSTPAFDIPFALYDDDAPGQVNPPFHGFDSSIALKASGMLSVREAILQGVAAGAIPRVWAEGHDLVQVGEPVHTSHVFAAVHPDLRENSRIRAVFDQITDYATRHPELFDHEVEC